jgi:TRAP-type C4-dicarboxylate transport system permease small subunit
MFRKALGILYDSAGALAALFMVVTLIMVLLSITGRLLNFYFPGTDAYAGYCTAAVGFLALAHTLRRGEHIRVTLILQRLPAKGERWLQILVHIIGVILTGAFAFFSVRLMLMSREIGDISTSNDATPLWIPQMAMALGAVILLVAVIHGLVDVIAGRQPPNALSSLEEPAHIE